MVWEPLEQVLSVASQGGRSGPQHQEKGPQGMAISMTVAVETQQIGEIDNIPFQVGMNVQQAMEQAYNLHQDSFYNFEIGYFGTDLGYYVSTLDSIRAQVGSDPNTFLFWELLVNGNPPTKG